MKDITITVRILLIAVVINSEDSNQNTGPLMYLLRDARATTSCTLTALF